MDSRARADAERVNKLIERYRPEPPPEERRARKSLFYMPIETRLQGAKMLNVRGGPNLGGIIGTFIKLRLVDQDFTWRER